MSPSQEKPPRQVSAKKKRLDPRLQVNDPPREGASDQLKDMPLVTIAWRALRAEGRRRAGEKLRLQEVLVAMAGEIFQLRRFALRWRKEADSPEMHRQEAELLAACDRLEASLADLGIQLVAPEGQPYTDELMELVENIAQVPDESVAEPIVSEIVAPAILYQGAIVRMGKAVIALPNKVKGSEDDSSLM